MNYRLLNRETLHTVINTALIAALCLFLFPAPWDWIVFTALLLGDGAYLAFKARRATRSGGGTD
jgi:hypothetical protein